MAPRRNTSDMGTQTGPTIKAKNQKPMVDKGTQTGPPTRDMVTQTEWVEDASTQTDPETPARASLMGLPAELRKQIFEEALTVYRDDHQPRLREREFLEIPKGMSPDARDFYDMPSGPFEIRICEIALMLVSHQAHTEAVEVFYRVNKFHYTVYFTRFIFYFNWCPRACKRPDEFPFHSQLEWMRDLSIDVMGTNLHPHTKIDSHIASHIELISATCPNLRKFTLHLLWENGREHTQEALRGQSFTADALAVMKVRDRISIIGTAPLRPVGHLGYADLRTAVAPEDCWDSSVLDDWPEISIQNQFYKGYRDGIERGTVAWRWDLDSSRRPRREAGTVEDGSARVEDVE